MRPLLNPSRDPVYQAIKIKRMLAEIHRHLENEAGLVEDPRFNQLIKDSSHLLSDLTRAYERYEQDIR